MSESAWGSQRSTLGTFLNPLSCNEPENLILSLNLELTDSVTRSGQQAPCVSPTPVLGLQVNGISLACLCGFWGIKAGT